MAKERNGTWKTVSIVSGIFLTLLGAAVAYGIMSGNVVTNCTRLDRVEPKVEAHEREIGILKTRQTFYENRQEAIYEGIQDIKDKLDGR